MKSKKIERILKVSTYGNVQDYPVLECIIEHINLLENEKRKKYCQFLNKINQTIAKCNQIQDLEFRINVKRKFEKEFRSAVQIYENQTLTLTTHLDNYVHAKFNNRYTIELHQCQQKEWKLQQQIFSYIQNIPVPQYAIFGSASSQDIDILVYVDKLGSIAENAQLCKKYTYVLENFLRDKFFANNDYIIRDINTNLGIIQDGKIIAVHKGTPDEVNNSVYHTAKHHYAYQNNPQLVTLLYDRTQKEYTHLKVKRCLRFILSFFSRIEELRPFIKPALKGNVQVRLDALKKINLTKHKDFSGKNEKVEDIYKVLAFQLAQTHLLIQGIEIYSKEEAIQHCTEFTNALKRQPLTDDDLTALQDSLVMLIINTTNLMSEMDSLDEPIFNH